MVSRRRFLLLAGSAGAVGAVAVAAPALLAGEDLEADRLPSIRYGQEACAHCGMIIDDDRFAAAWTTLKDEVHFDDIGCLVLEAAERPSPPEARHYVSTYHDGAWVEAPTASYVFSLDIRSPMAYGLAAAADHDTAGRLAQETDGTILAWHKLAEQLHNQAPDGQEHG